MRRSIELLEALKQSGVNATLKDPLWWPNSGTFDVVVGAVLTQQSKWERVEESLQRLRSHAVLHVEALADAQESLLKHCIQPSGCFEAKAKNLKALAVAIGEEFGSFEAFALHVTRPWLLAQRGIGPETADAILCYGCYQEALVVDRYTAILLAFYGYTFEDYESMQEWCLEGLEEEARLDALYGKRLSKAEVYARFHGKIVEFCKGKVKKGVLTQGVPGLYPD